MTAPMVDTGATSTNCEDVCQTACAGPCQGDTIGQATERRARTLTAWLIDNEGPDANLNDLADCALTLWDPETWSYFGVKARVGRPTTAVQCRVVALLREQADQPVRRPSAECKTCQGHGFIDWGGAPLICAPCGGTGWTP